MIYVANMKKINVELKKNPYLIVIEKDFRNIKTNLRMKKGECSKFIVITDNIVANYYLDIFKREINHPIEKVYHYIIPNGENSKCLEVIRLIYQFLIKIKVEKDDVIFALGGGVVGDIAGFVAATYLRGVSFVQVPTTLLSQVDSAIGGKTGVNFNGLKNIIGSFYQPKLVYINMKTLSTLSKREVRNGLAEIIVHGIISDSEIVNVVEDSVEKIFELKEEVMDSLIYNNCKIKARIIAQDELDKGLRNILNFGHTYGHAIESIYEFKYAHGECVSMGVVAAFKTSVFLNLISIEKAQFVIRVLEKVGLPTQLKHLDWRSIVDRIHYDKKINGGIPTFILPLDIGKVTQRQLLLEDSLIMYLKSEINN